MKTDTLIVNVIAGVLMIVVYCFLFSDKTDTRPNDVISIVVKNGVYFPSMIQIQAGKAVQLTFLRKDVNDCAGVVNFPQLNMTYQLPFNQQVMITLPPMDKGEIDFVCPAGNYRGKLRAV